ncbi:phosphate signaling complex protein PhoU [Halarsenatibacter silvermanii]|uniref:Phosphate-specific transport system accessory protein PhoU n=1 Tax=Halarsenatibacter silvermanii TaxID=321763 RepID=A0A1G9I6X4_9FIRM|nr:phosphate signaling complex protein PhoU [Halarsenatibacter silvermanii]SDL20981.1 phosphate uptake regulator, PhoU [Halarsenatibacter silvermanii]
MENDYEQKRQEIIDDLSDMSEIANEMLQNSIKALDDQDGELARQIINRDDVLDNFEVTIEDKISRLLTLRSPIAGEARYAMAMLKITRDLERIGDHSTNIAEIALELRNEEYLEPLVMIPELAELVLDMLDAVLEAFVTENHELAEAACRKDERVDNINDRIYEESLRIIDNASDNERDINQAMRFVTVAKSLERIGDHATNIGEETIFVSTGNRVKY